MPAGESSIDDRLISQCSRFERISVCFLPFSSQSTISTEFARNPPDVRLWQKTFAAGECLAMSGVSSIQRQPRPVDIARSNEQKDLERGDFMLMCQGEA